MTNPVDKILSSIERQVNSCNSHGGTIVLLVDDALALLAERADLKQKLAAAAIAAENCELFRMDSERWQHARADTSAGKSDILIVKKIWGDGQNYTQEIILTGANADAAVDAARAIADT